MAGPRGLADGKIGTARWPQTDRHQTWELQLPTVQVPVDLQDRAARAELDPPVLISGVWEEIYNRGQHHRTSKLWCA